MSLQLIEVGKRHCRVLYILPAQPELILHRKCEHSGRPASQATIILGRKKRHCRVLDPRRDTALPCPYLRNYKLMMKQCYRQA